ncbi:head-tail joining protein [Sporomusa termitida]|uniref:Uncharacterized protein n=1 Tax=Sporomusa termitida TaxID=2377 RepID=A0A517DVP9_9FIRM|nr:hypothetical protein [Sporomusa termitida]QDR81346.1 hypothetical protein SPTER_27250 [Sporomusa termitida]
MSIKEQIARDNAIFLDLDAFAELILYNGRQIPAVVALGDSAMRGNTFEQKGRSAVATLQIAASDVSGPETGDQVVYHSATWEVTHVLESDGAMHLLQMICNASPWS